MCHFSQHFFLYKAAANSGEHVSSVCNGIEKKKKQEVLTQARIQITSYTRTPRKIEIYTDHDEWSVACEKLNGTVYI